MTLTTHVRGVTLLGEVIGMDVREQLRRLLAWVSVRDPARACAPPNVGALVEVFDEAQGIRSALYQWDRLTGPEYLYMHWADVGTSIGWRPLRRVTRRIYVPMTGVDAVRLKFGLLNVVDVLRGPAPVWVVDHAGDERRAWMLRGAELDDGYLPPRAHGLLTPQDLALRDPPYQRVTNVTGIAGFMSASEVAAVLGASPDWMPVGVGVLASFKTLYEGGNRHRLRYAARKDIAGIFPDHPRAENLVHYATETQGMGLVAELVDAFNAGGPLCHGLQVNVAWPSSEALAAFRKVKPAARIILQVKLTGAMMDGFVGAKLYNYGGVIDGVLLDVSGGTGVELDPARIAPLVASLATLHPRIRVGIAGGLTAVRLMAMEGPLAALMTRYTWLSMDTENGVRDQAPGGGNMVLAEALAYVAMAGRIWDKVLGQVGLPAGLPRRGA